MYVDTSALYSPTHAIHSDQYTTGVYYISYYLTGVRELRVRHPSTNGCSSGREGVKVGRSKRVRGLGWDRRHVASIVTRSDWIAIGCGDIERREEREKERKKERKRGGGGRGEISALC